MLNDFPLIASLLLAAALTFIGPSPGWANDNDLVIEQAWFEDHSGKMTWETARQQTMTSFEGALSAGYGPGPIWLRVRLDPGRAGMPPDSQIYIRIGPAYLDEIILFDSMLETSAALPQGDTHPKAHQPEPSTQFIFTLPAGTEPRDVWLRLQTNSARLVYFEAMTQADFRLSNLRTQHWSSLYLGVLCVFFAWGVIQALIRKERLIIAFVFYQTTALLVGFCMLGYAYLYLSDSSPTLNVDLLTNVMIVTSTAAAATFSYFLLEELDLFAWIRKFFFVLFLIFAALISLLLIGHTRLVLQTNMIIIAAIPWILLAAAVVSSERAPASDELIVARLPKQAIVAYFGASLFFIIFSALPLLGIIENSILSTYSLLIYSLTCSVMMLLILEYRAQKILELQGKIRASVIKAQTQAEQEKKMREDRERLLSILGHELKTPLATIRMQLGRNEIPRELSQLLESQVADMTHILERSLELSLIEGGHIEPVEEPFDVLALISRLRKGLPEGDRIDFYLPDRNSMMVNTDPELLKTVVRNLMDNALKYSLPQSPVRLQVTPPDSLGKWELWVSNLPGCAGMPDEKRIFQKYYRSPKATNRSGSGLGLYLIHGLVQLLHGDLRYVPGEGEVHFQLIMQSIPEGASV
jgi:two-component system, sensor histidine kinase LadS